MNHEAPLILAVDQGSGSTKAIVVDAAGNVRARSKAEITTAHPQAGWVEQDAEEIWASVLRAIRDITSTEPSHNISAVGLSTQRESLVVWERASGQPVSPVLTWQDRRTAPLIDSLNAHQAIVTEITGLPLSPMFSAAKAAWVLDEVDPDRQRSRAGELCIGTVDSWLLWKLGAGHVIEIGNASRTQLLNIATGTWSEELLEIFNIPVPCLPIVVGSDHVHAAPSLMSLGIDAPVTGVMGDSHAAFFAHGGWIPGRIKVTYGTGSSIMARSPEGITHPELIHSGVTRTIAWSMDGEIVTALEGNILSTGATLVWLAELFSTTVEDLLACAKDHETNVHLVPAFSGLGAPWWDSHARGLIDGLTLGTRMEDLAAAAVNSIPFQVNDVLQSFAAVRVPVDVVLADGGPSTDAMVMQRQADIAGCEVSVSSITELSAYGAAALAGVRAGIWGLEHCSDQSRGHQAYVPRSTQQMREDWVAGWASAVSRARYSSHQRVTEA